MSSVMSFLVDRGHILHFCQTCLKHEACVCLHNLPRCRTIPCNLSVTWGTEQNASLRLNGSTSQQHCCSADNLTPHTAEKQKQKVLFPLKLIIQKTINDAFS